MQVDVEVTLSDDIPPVAANAMTFFAVAAFLCRTARKLGVTKEQLIARMPNVIEEGWKGLDDEG